MNDRQKVATISLAVAAGFFGIYWLAAQWFPTLLREEVLIGVVPLAVAIAVLAPILRGVQQ